MNLDRMEKMADRIMAGVKGYVETSFRLYESRLEKLVGEFLAKTRVEVEEAIAARIASAVQDAVENEVRRIEVVVPDPIPGKDGAPGRDGADGRTPSADELAAAVDVAVHAFLARNPPRDGKDGRDGVDGRDGISFDMVEVSTINDRTARFVFVGGDKAHSVDVQLPGIVDKGVYHDDLEAAKGDAVTWDGSLWIAQRASSGERPGTSDAWRLAVKHGRPGRDLTQPKESTPREPIKLR